MGRGSLRAPGLAVPRWLLSLLLLSRGPVSGAWLLPGNTSGEPVTTPWVLDGQPWLTIVLKEPISTLDSGLVALEAEGQEFLLELEKNHRLLAAGYTETHYSQDGQPVVLVPNHMDHCHYHGRVRGFPNSSVMLSTCSGMRGLIRLNSNASYYLQPWPPGDPEDLSTHRTFRMERLLTWKGTCSYSDPEDKGGMARLRPAPQSRYLTQHRNLNHTKERLLEVASYVDQILRTLDIQVVLTGLEVWTEQDHSRVTPDANATLWDFLKWRRGLWARRPHDSAQLLTGCTFRGATVGLAPVEGMCRAESSGGVSTDHSELPIGAAATMAHEIGHSLGLSHDLDGCCVEAAAEQGGCIMAAATGHPFPRLFSACSRRQLRAFFRKGGGACLYNAPDPGLQIPPTRCGNGFVEAGEECDCGSEQKCPDPCCFAHNCSLHAGAQCAHGDCCARCLLKPAGSPCRQAAGDCDLPEFCTGSSPHCPPDVYLLDGLPCAGGQGYCLDGACPTLEQQCAQLWGPGSRPAPEACFQLVNPAGDATGNCGQDGSGRFLPCAQRDTQCGKLQCQGGEPSPLVPHILPVESTLHLDGHQVACRAALVIPDAQLDLLDLGLVEPGTQCGPRMVCQDRRCQNTSSQELERCLTTCHNHGVCNSNHNCHCSPGWAPPFCDKPGFGGSVDSGPVHPENGDTFLLAVLFSFLLPLLPGVGLAWCYFRLPGLHLQRCPGGYRRDQECSGPKDGPLRNHSLGGIYLVQLGSVAIGDPQPLATDVRISGIWVWVKMEMRHHFLETRMLEVPWASMGEVVVFPGSWVITEGNKGSLPHDLQPGAPALSSALESQQVKSRHQDPICGGKVAPEMSRQVTTDSHSRNLDPKDRHSESTDLLHLLKLGGFFLPCQGAPGPKLHQKLLDVVPALEGWGMLGTASSPRIHPQRIEGPIVPNPQQGRPLSWEPGYVCFVHFPSMQLSGGQGLLRLNISDGAHISWSLALANKQANKIFDISFLVSSYPVLYPGSFCSPYPDSQFSI
ncbi:disintegrin and metalloproteinase domain-containing protein 33 isoform X3 [Heterocephalus glaber]|uniref:Disintegrin and metalloproteinase domain-containing protein 33 isoform X3 n=1 Tax=Heterocephalus glaber TaxID=10181 RepID=A0AAX6SN58_HETGA|nr:disintegrin and metalloproteinase domain-containing protein 33 isoform X3 [Heterocephalus glaber]